VDARRADEDAALGNVLVVELFGDLLSLMVSRHLVLVLELSAQVKSRLLSSDVGRKNGKGRDPAFQLIRPDPTARENEAPFVGMLMVEKE
jgi:hypothetical protein